MTQICVFEDVFCKNLEPLTLTRPVYLLRLGIKDLLSKILDHVSSDFSVCLHCRQEVAHTLESYKYPVNKLGSDDILFINGRLLVQDEELAQLCLNSKKEFTVTYSDVLMVARVSAKRLKGFKLPELFDKKTFKAFDLEEKTINLKTMNYFWDFLSINAQEINIDARKTGLLGKHNSPFNLGHMVKSQDIFIGKDVVFHPGVILDASSGPIFIDNGVEIMSNAVIMGPAYIGFKTKLKIGSKIYGPVTIGPVCKIGGELEGSIIQGYTNKQHEGFLGHAYLGEWVNLGAGTENSDLKNNYHSVNVEIRAGEVVKSQQTFVGCCIGDHTKTGIKTMINTGSVFGCFSNIFGPGYQPKFVESFTWQDSAAKKPVLHDITKAIQTAKVVLGRRGLQMLPAQEKLYKKIFTNRSA